MVRVGRLLLPIFLVGVSAAFADDEACVKTPDGSIVCGESINRQPALHSPKEPMEEPEPERKSGYSF